MTELVKPYYSNLRGKAQEAALKLAKSILHNPNLQGRDISVRVAKINDIMRESYKAKCIGSGSYNRVYAYGKNKVVKISSRSDYGSIKYLKWCVDNQHIKTTPRVHFLAFNLEDQLVCIMERLMEAPRGVFAYPTEQFLEGAISVKEYTKKLQREVSAYSSGFLWAKRDAKAIHMTKRLTKWASGPTAKQAMKYNDYHDMHSDNVMMRRNRMLVITDPSTG